MILSLEKKKIIMTQNDQKSFENFFSIDFFPPSEQFFFSA